MKNNLVTMDKISKRKYNRKKSHPQSRNQLLKNHKLVSIWS